ncbi:hypothetical protein HYU22_03890 [Candidatus Woesearchaeota archaeon]|nr:hypothetical protein [Candidatus Woesearchaeota archaeon]
MDEIPFNQPYEGIIRDFQLVKTIPLKLYFTDFLGRDSKTYEWRQTNLSPSKLNDGLERFLLNTDHVGVPHVAVAFPHITTVFRFGDPRIRDERETNMYLVGRAPTSEQDAIIPKATAEPIALGCLLELNPILSEEISFWASSRTVDEYLSKSVTLHGSLKVVDSNKLRRALGEYS